MVNGDSYLPVLKPVEAVKRARAGEFPNRDHYRGFIPMVLKRVINKAMAVDPKDRYQSAEEIRRALEAVSVAMDWEESTLLNGKKWSGNDGKRDLEVTRTKMTDGQWELQVRKAGIGKLLRKDNSMCKTGMNEKKAMRETYRVLQKFVSGKA